MNVSTQRIVAASASVPVATPEAVRVAAWVAAVVVLAFAAFTAVQLTGGSPNSLNNLGYVSIAFAAYRFGVRGGLPAGILFGMLVGPGAALIAVASVEPPQVWLVRIGAYAGIGLLVGILFDVARGALARSERDRTRVTEHQRHTLLALARGAEAKDTDTGEHVLRVQLIAESLATATGASPYDAEQLGWAAMLHDIGKLHVPDAILLKPGPLSADEWEIVRRHPVWGAEILGTGRDFELARKIARWHHEDFDGSGYPDRLVGSAIPLEARIVRIADAFDAMTNDRPYRPGMAIDDALEELDRCAGRQFDPDLVRLAIERLRYDGLLRNRLARTSLRERGRFS